MAQHNELRPIMEKLIEAFQKEDDSDLLHREELDQIFRILEANKDKSPEEDKKAELAKLLTEIDHALQQCKARSQQQQPAKAKKKMPSVSDCNPFKPRPSPSSMQQDALAPSVEALLQQTIAILGHAPSTNSDAAVDTEFYEWTTSYVDESRIYGWSEDANKVVDALVGVEGAAAEDEDDVMFRAAGIAGIHGSGKTALAQKVFVHDRIKDAFPLRLWVCVGPPDSEDRPSLLFRMLDNLGLDTAKVETIVDESAAVRASDDKEKSKIGVLLFILYVTLYKTGYLIVFDDIRAYDGKDGWYSNLTLEPPRDGEWFERLAYGLPKARKSAVLVTCRREDDARIMVRTGGVFRPPKLDADNGWKLFEREYNEAKKKLGSEGKEDKLYKELEQMKKEIVDKCLGLPVAIIQAAKGFAELEHEPDDDPPPEGKPAADSKTEPAETDANQAK